MGMTMTQKILAAHAGLPEVKAGQLIRAKLDMVLGNDITSPVAIREFDKEGFTGVFDKSKISMVMDHFTPNKDIKAAEQCLQCRTFAHRFDIDNFYDVGQMGVEHALLPEKGLVAAGDCIIGADSHTCTYGALGAFSTGVGSTDMAAGMATGETWFKVPEAIKVHLTGTLPPMVSGKDVILHLIGLIGVDGALYKALEFGGSVIDALPVEGRLTMANMAIEAGGKVGLFAVDELTRQYCAEHGRPGVTMSLAADEGAVYERVVDIDVTGQEPVVACPHLPSNVKNVSELKDLSVQQVVVGSCTNGRISDMRDAAEILRGRKVAKGVRCIILPSTPAVWKQCLKEGLMEVFMDAGCIVGPCTCGPCLGGHMGILGDGERAVATTNRNFRGRMGSLDSEVYLSSPVVAAASAVAGCIAGPDQL